MMCQKPICISCLSVDHKKHTVVDIEEQKEKEIEIMNGQVTRIIQNVGQR